MIRPQPLIAPRPNVRKHPLDRHELEMIDDANYDGQGKSCAQEATDSARMLVIALVLVVAVGLVIWWLWRI